jgi:hypothetical protein
MNPSQAFANSVSTVVLSQVFNGELKINLEAISNSSTSSKVGIGIRPSYDSSLKSISANGLYYKNVQENIFPRENALQIARSLDVLKGTLPLEYEYDPNITFRTTTLNGQPFTLTREVLFDDVQELFNLVFLIDIKYNDNTITNLSTYDKDLSVYDGYYGNLFSNKTLYKANSSLIKVDSSKQSSDIQINDGAPGGGLTLSGYTPLLRESIQTDKHIGGFVTIRLIFVKDGNVLLGPLRGGKFKIDGASQTIDPKNAGNTISLSLVKTWENINQISGVRTADSYLRSKDPNDGFFKNASNAEFFKTFKEG